MSHFASKRVVVVLLAFLSLALAACGGGGSDEAEQPLAVSLKIDGSVTTQVAGIQSAYAEGTALLANLVVARGGAFDAAVFRGSAAGYGIAAINSDPEISLARRRRDSRSALAGLGDKLGQILGIAEMTPAVAARLARLPEGSAVGDALREAVAGVQGRPGERWAVVLSDGINNTNGEELPLGSVERTVRILREAVGDVDASGVNVAIIGVGMSKGGMGSTRANPLAAAWRQVCRELNASSCAIEQEPALPVALQGVS